MPPSGRGSSRWLAWRKRRADYHRRKIDHWPYRDVGALEQRRTRYFIFHADAHEEAVHWSKFPDHSQLHHFIVPGGNHRLVLTLRKRKVLKKIVMAAIAGKSRCVRLALQREPLIGQQRALRRRDYEQRYPKISSCLALPKDFFS